jgi:hypothetical protein
MKPDQSSRSKLEGIATPGAGSACTGNNNTHNLAQASEALQG